MSHPDYENIGSPYDRVIEECSEVIKAICKAKRFGIENWHPDTPEINNAHQILMEISDLRKVMDFLEPILKKYAPSFQPSKDSKDEAIKIMRETLKWYSNVKIYQGANQKAKAGEETRDGGYYLLDVHTDCGNKARNALTQSNKLLGKE